MASPVLNAVKLFGTAQKVLATSTPSSSSPAPAPAPSPVSSPAPAPKPSGTGMMFTGEKNAQGIPDYAAFRPDVDYANDTVEGRVGNLLRTDDKGNYTHDVVRQAVDRQHQAFNARGLLNTSMAQQAGQEAAISKALDIAAVDAKTYADNRARLDEQDFQLRGDYQKAVQDVNTNFQKMVDTINASPMSPEDKSVAIAQAQSVRDGELAYQNNLYNNMPRWKTEWLALAVPSAGVDVNTLGNYDTLANIANDPAQPADRRAAATARIAALRGGADPSGSAPGTYGPTNAAFAAKSAPAQVAVDGIKGPKGPLLVNFDVKAGNGMTYRQQYEDYLKKGGNLSPSKWLATIFGGVSYDPSGNIGDGVAGDGPGGGGGNGVGVGGDSDSGIGGGMSA